VVVSCGRTIPRGRLPVFSVADQEEAEALIVLTCPRDDSGNYYARELVEEQTIENLEAFSTKLDQAHDVLVAKGHCRCGSSTDRATMKSRGGDLGQPK
jgi:hypothetical protein